MMMLKIPLNIHWPSEVFSMLSKVRISFDLLSSEILIFLSSQKWTPRLKLLPKRSSTVSKRPSQASSLPSVSFAILRKFELKANFAFFCTEKPASRPVEDSTEKSVAKRSIFDRLERKQFKSWKKYEEKKFSSQIF